MNPFAQAWKTKPAVLPVIHVDHLEQARDNTKIAFDAGADGVFLINHYMSGWDLLKIAEKIREEFPGKWLGVNCLGFYNTVAIQESVERGFDGVWVDNAYIDEDTYIDEDKAEQERAADIRKAHLALPNADRVLYFAGVAFKTQRPSKNPRLAAKLAGPYMDVITTSGPNTAMAPDPDKIRQMRDGAGDHLLAIASGLTPENVRTYLPYTNCFLVASGISRSWTELDPEKVRAFVQAVRS